MKAHRLLRVSLTVSHLEDAAKFYTDALNFTAAGPAVNADQSWGTALAAGPFRTIQLRRGNQMLELANFATAGASYPAGSASNDLWFQHCALATNDIAQAYAQLLEHRFTPISRNGPQPLPGGIVAFKFRDPDGHPLELIQFPQANAETAGGIDHSAIAVADAAASIAFYAQTLGLGVASKQVNTGPAQDAMDNLAGAEVDVVGLTPTHPAPHLELLGYRHPRGRISLPLKQNDIAASRLVFSVDDGPMRLMHDLDGHSLVLVK